MLWWQVDHSVGYLSSDIYQVQLKYKNTNSLKKLLTLIRFKQEIKKIWNFKGSLKYRVMKRRSASTIFLSLRNFKHEFLNLCCLRQGSIQFNLGKYLVTQYMLSYYWITFLRTVKYIVNIFVTVESHSVVSRYDEISQFPGLKCVMQCPFFSLLLWDLTQVLAKPVWLYGIAM